MSIFERLILRLPHARKVVDHLHQTQDELDYFKSKLDVADELYDSFCQSRSTPEYMEVYEVDKPLVSICIPTYNRCKTLLERSVPSALSQDYENIEVIVVGDGCTDDTEEMIKEIKDERLSFVNLTERGVYPEDIDLCWMVAGIPPVNACLSRAKGSFITHLDDDDEYFTNRISALVTHIQSTRADVVWHPFHRELPSGKWGLVSPRGFARNQVTNSSILYHNWFKRITYDLEAYKLREPGDWNRYRKFKYLGAKCALYPRPLVRHHKEHNRKFLTGT